MAKREAAKASPRGGGRDDGAPDTAEESAPVPKAGGKGRQAGKVSKAPKPAKAAAVFTITDVGDHLAATFDLPKSHAKIYLAEAVALIAKQLKRGAKVRLAGLGVFQVKKRAARKARNPNTGEEVKVKAGKRVVFAASQTLKDKL